MDRQLLDAIEAFVHVADRKSFRAAARDLNVSPSALSQKIKGLEERSGVPLFSRTTRSVGLTQAGAILYAKARPALADIASAYDEARNLRAPAGLLRLHIPHEIIPTLIEPVLKGFLTTYPKIEIEVIADTQSRDLAEEGFDAGVTLGETVDPDMVALRLTPPMRFLVVGTPDYFARRGRPMRPNDLRSHDCVRLRIGTDRIARWAFLDASQIHDVPVTGSVITNDYSLSIGAAMQGVSLAYVSGGSVGEAIADGRLETVLDDYMPVSKGIFLYYPNKAQVLPKLRAFIDYVQTARGA